MAHKPRKKSVLPQQLELALQWAKDMDKEVKIIEAETADSRRVPVLQVFHGKRWVIVSAKASSVSVVVPLKIPESARKKITKLPDNIQEKAIFMHRQQLLSYGRIGYILTPLGVRKLGDVEGVLIEEVLRLSPREYSTFNRFADAVQEVITAGVWVLHFIGGMSSGEEPAESVDSSEAVNVMYV